MKLHNPDHKKMKREVLKGLIDKMNEEQGSRLKPSIESGEEGVLSEKDEDTMSPDEEVEGSETLETDNDLVEPESESEDDKLKKMSKLRELMK